VAESHGKRHAAALQARGGPIALTDAELLERLLPLNHQRAAKTPN